ncbi:MAG: ATP-binding protein [Nocardioidaceae bacterium]
MTTRDGVSPAVTVSRLEAGFGPVQALDGIDLEVRRGELVGIAGESGAGKTTLIRCISGDLPPTAGHVSLAIGARTEVVWQELALCDNLDVASNLLLGRESRRMMFAQARAHRTARELLEELDLDLGGTTPLVGDLNDARRQLLAVARAASSKPDVLLLDEPTAPLGVVDTANVERIVRKLHAGRGTVLMVSHDIEQLFRIAERIVVLRKGRIAGEVDPARGHPDDVITLLSGHELETSAHHQLTRLHALTDRLASADPSSSLLMILTALGTALGADQLAMHVVDEDGGLRLACSLGLPEALRSAWRVLPVGIGGGPMGLAASTQHTRVDADVRTGESWRPYREPAWGARIASSWAVPFSGTDGLAGVVTIFRDRIGGPTRDELDLVTLYGGHAVSALERDRLVGELTSRNLVLETIRDVLETLAGPVPVAEALDTALRALQRGVQADEAAVFSTLEDGTVGCRAHVCDDRRVDLDALVEAHRRTTLADGRVEPLPVQPEGWGFAVSFVSREGIDTLVALRRRGAATEETGALVEDAAHSVRLALERERAQLAVQETAALRRSQDLQRQFLARLSHELRTPLTAIGGYADSLMLGDVTWDTESQDRFLSRIAAESQRLRRLVDDLLDHSAIESGVMRLQPDWCNLGLLVDAAVACLASDARRSVHVDVDEEVPAIWADHDRLEQMLLNLLDNAIRHNPPDTKVWVRVVGDGPDRVVVEVRDDGSGTPDSVAAAPFVLHREKRGPTAGAGLGLSITSAIVVAHGGTIELRTAEPGTRFVIGLPIGGPGGSAPDPEPHEVAAHG